MNIQGVEVLTEKIIYSPQWFGIIAWIGAMAIGLLFLSLAIDEEELWQLIIGSISLVLFIVFAWITFEENHSTFLNKPSKIQYEIEITDDNAWKELGPNYDVLEKLYENKEIYRIKGDYINDNT